jgi:L-ascorbate metabolism protein UlaG (beta-lactamase superfamily)
MIDILFVNHATSFIRIDDICILTDPIWSEWAGFPIIGARRIKEPGIRIVEIPKLDVVLLSHNHFDHMDIPTLKYLQKKFNPIFVTGLGNKEFLRKNGLRSIFELNWWEKVTTQGINIHFVPAQHWSGRMPWDIDTTLWGGFVIDTPEGQVYFAGDTAYNESYFKIIQHTFENIKASFLPISPSAPIFKIQHMNPDEAVKAHKVLNSKLSIGIHTGTFRLGIDDNIKDLSKAIKANNINNNEFIMLKHGEMKQI